MSQKRRQNDHFGFMFKNGNLYVKHTKNVQLKYILRIENVNSLR